MSDKDLEEMRVHFLLHDINNLIKENGVKFFVDNLDRYSKIALSDYYRKLIEVNNELNRET